MDRVNRRNIIRRGAGAIVAAGIGTGIVASKDSREEVLPPRHFVLILLDRSGSMANVRESVVTNLNKYLDEQRVNAGMSIGLLQFDSIKTADGCYCQPIFGFTDVASTPRLSLNDYVPRSGTPLLAAVAEAIGKLEQAIRPHDRALLVVQTDGYENASPPEVTKSVIKQLIDAKAAQGNWTFAFMGADIDAWGEGGSLGMMVGSTLGYANNAVGTSAAWTTTADSTTSWYTTTGGGTISALDFGFVPSNTNTSFYNKNADNIVFKKNKDTKDKTDK